MTVRVWVGVTLLCCWVASALGNDQVRQRMETWSTGYPAESHGVGLFNGDRLREIYEQRNYSLLWFTAAPGRTEEAALGLAGGAVLARIANISEDGLLPADYHWPQLRSLQRGEQQQQQRQQQRGDKLDDLAQYDLLLTDAFISLADHLVTGKIDPESLTHEWKANRGKVDAMALLAQLLASDEPARVLAGLLPRQARYHRMKQTMVALQPLVDLPWPALGAAPLLKPGASDPRLEEIARRLRVWGDLTTDPATDVYGAELQQAVRRFQLRHGLDQDGVIGAQTVMALNMSPRQRQQQLALNLERWRWLPEDLGSRYIVVNLAAFELKVYENNVNVMNKRVIVGRDQRKSPVFSDNIRYLVFNPTWTVPPRLAINDKLPEIRRDSNYLQRLGFTVYPGGSNIAIDPATIDWSKYGRKNFPFRLVQAPGPQNALGQVKFMFPNPYDVYLHDTPSRELFAQSRRAFSSGCIRVEDPLALATYLLRENGWDRNKIDAVIATGKLETVYLKKPMPVHLEYWTAWVNSEGVMHFREDIYRRDDSLWQALQAPRIAPQTPLAAVTAAAPNAALNLH
ncbi:L,D-transpeptidase family protein [Pseudomaricurvus alcaniphilus]|uniref:L,D-transpeptidase family protein n=1 Tax=Pseudomaricurvus alcaniphilus TaxID=1166482 RepID=UPI00140733F8|nr:L,D-transpeptidase family protein [Pseudomaricurvus alcaniphilus]NHN38449.1 L,D-transpeptidase family protein [Pseudomaricurvus alcaniphilus]